MLESWSKRFGGEPLVFTFSDQARDITNIERSSGARQAAPLQPTSQFEHGTIFLPVPLVTEPLSTKILGIMGAYKGRVNVKHRKRRAAKVERLKTVAAKKEDTKKTA